MKRPDSSIAIALIAASVALILLAYVTAFFPAARSVGGWIMALGLVLNVTGGLTLGAQHGRPASRVFVAAIVLTAALIGIGLAVGLWSVGATLTAGATKVVLGFPSKTAVLLYTVAVVPLVVLPLVYAFTFDRLTLSDDDLTRVRAARRS